MYKEETVPSLDIPLLHSNVSVSPRYLGQLVPELIEMGEDLGMDFGAADAVDISEDTQYPPPQHEGRVRVPTGQSPARDDADIIGQTLTAVCMSEDGAKERGVCEIQTWWICHTKVLCRSPLRKDFSLKPSEC